MSMCTKLVQKLPISALITLLICIPWLNIRYVQQWVRLIYGHAHRSISVLRVLYIP